MTKIIKSENGIDQNRPNNIFGKLVKDNNFKRFKDKNEAKLIPPIQSDKLINILEKLRINILQNIKI